MDILDGEDEALHRTILNGLRTFNAELFSNHPPGQDLAIALRDPRNREAVGGLIGRASRGWLEIELIFVPEEFRGMGLATQLIARAEVEAARRGCHSAWLNTLNSKARLLYERLGYTVFGELKDYPVGSNRTFLQKKLG
ncbi:GNAT family N-acetyltransferase [Microvirga sp. 2YAF29]|uniref:GNAT family N-acetyltransferase n=1 Tax=Microvirga sp. 2YAF29 TaxID=3233031 RepID=UPI003F9D833A